MDPNRIEHLPRTTDVAGLEGSPHRRAAVKACHTRARQLVALLVRIL